MSILIKGLEMPEDKAIAVVIHPDGTAYSAEMFAGVCTKYLMDCEAIPVPDHGRLIDADALLESEPAYTIPNYNSDGYLADAEGAYTEVQIENAPTIIPASGGTENVDS